MDLRKIKRLFFLLSFCILPFFKTSYFPFKIFRKVVEKRKISAATFYCFSLFYLLAQTSPFPFKVSQAILWHVLGAPLFLNF